MYNWRVAHRREPVKLSLICFLNCREKRAMPWRKVYMEDLPMAEKGQRAYEVCSSSSAART